MVRCSTHPSSHELAAHLEITVYDATAHFGAQEVLLTRQDRSELGWVLSSHSIMVGALVQGQADRDPVDEAILHLSKGRNFERMILSCSVISTCLVALMTPNGEAMGRPYLSSATPKEFAASHANPLTSNTFQKFSSVTRKI